PDNFTRRKRSTRDTTARSIRSSIRARTRRTATSSITASRPRDHGCRGTGQGPALTPTAVSPILGAVTATGAGDGGRYRQKARLALRRGELRGPTLRGRSGRRARAPRRRGFLSPKKKRARARA